MSNLVIGNIISFIAAIFMMYSTIINDREKVFFYQFLNCVFLVIASWFFSSYSGMLMLGISAIRNHLVSKDKFTKNTMILFVVISVVFGIYVNNRGLIGLISIIATVQYTICSYYIRSEQNTRYSIWVNVFLWVIYSLLILDISTFSTDFVTLIITTIAIFKNRKKSHSE